MTLPCYASFSVAPSGLVIFYFFTRGFTPGYVLSALRACCRAKRLFALHEKAAEGLIYPRVRCTLYGETHKKRIPPDWLAWQVFFTPRED